jgi:hypothetical protein
LLLEVVPERAVVWTQPADWEVNLESPLEGAKRTDRGQFAALIADGSVRMLPTSIDAASLKAWLTRAGGERITPP